MRANTPVPTAKTSVLFLSPDGYLEFPGRTAPPAFGNFEQLRFYRRIVLPMSCTISVQTQKINVNFVETFFCQIRCFYESAGGWHPPISLCSSL